MKKRLLTSLYKAYESLSRPRKRWLLAAIDISIFILSIGIAFSIRFRLAAPVLEVLSDYWPNILVFILIKSAVFHLLGIYRPILRYTGLEFIATITRAIVCSCLVQVILSFVQNFWPLPKSVLIVDILLTLVFAVSARLIIRSFLIDAQRGIHPDRPLDRLLIYGAGIAGLQLARTIKHEPGYRIVAFVDDNSELQNQTIQGFKIYAPSQISQIVLEESIDTLILAMPSIDKPRRRQIIDQLEGLPVAIKTVPSYGEILTNKVSISEIRRVDVADLLGREEVMPDPALLSRNVSGKAVLVTGAGGSIGSELCRQIAHLDPTCLILYELNEFALYSIDMELSKTHPDLDIHSYLGNVTDSSHLIQVLTTHNIQTIYHAAAYKHVPLVEANPTQGIFNNIQGTLIAAQCAIQAQVKNFVLISTDKAVRPTNVMGASKRTAELVVQALAGQPSCPTCFGIVRFGNVLDSSGSVVPHFRKQIAEGKAITVTHPEVTRYFMSIPEAVRLVMQAGAMAKGGEVFLLEMGEPVRIYDLAERMIRLSGLTPGRDIEIKITGLRPGEKLFEELLINGNNIKPTKHPKIFCAFEHKFTWKQLEPMLQELFLRARHHQTSRLIQQLQLLVPEYQPDAKLFPRKHSNVGIQGKYTVSPFKAPQISSISEKQYKSPSDRSGNGVF